MSNGASKGCGGSKMSGSKFGNTLVNQTPVYSRILKCVRPRKKRGKGPHYL
jgi:hypothetical protein